MWSDYGIALCTYLVPCMHTQIYIDSLTPRIHIAQCTPSGINQPTQYPLAGEEHQPSVHQWCEEGLQSIHHHQCTQSGRMGNSRLQHDSGAAAGRGVLWAGVQGTHLQSQSPTIPEECHLCQCGHKDAET